MFTIILRISSSDVTEVVKERSLHTRKAIPEMACTKILHLLHTRMRAHARTHAPTHTLIIVLRIGRTA